MSKLSPYKPLLMIGGMVGLLAVIGWVWSERPRPVSLFTPTWTNSVRLYGQPHAIWLDRYSAPGCNLPLLRRTLSAAARERQIPELVIYAIPMRDLGQSSEGGFRNYEDYLADNRLNTELIAQFVKASGLHPIVYLEPDSLSLAVQHRQDERDAQDTQGVANAIYQQRIQTIRSLIALYRNAGARVYLDAGHSGWFDYGEENIQRIASALNEAGIAEADGLASNISNRQPVIAFRPNVRTEHHYLQRLLPLLDNTPLDVRVDTSRNGGPTHARHYYLSPEGALIDDETPQGRLVGHWRSTPQGEMVLAPFFGPQKTLHRLTAREKYRYNSAKSLLTAPAWLDAVGDVQPGPAPTDSPPSHVSDVIRGYRYIKPPDDCDGALNCPPGESKQAINAQTAQKQTTFPALPAHLWP